jgi:hypothetical protein
VVSLRTLNRWEWRIKATPTFGRDRSIRVWHATVLQAKGVRIESKNGGDARRSSMRRLRERSEATQESWFKTAHRFSAESQRKNTQLKKSTAMCWSIRFFGVTVGKVKSSEPRESKAIG